MTVETNEHRGIIECLHKSLNLMVAPGTNVRVPHFNLQRRGILMFEGLDTQVSTRKPWAVAVSFFGQCLFVAAAIVLPMMLTDTLPRAIASVVIPIPLPPPPPAPKAAKQVTRVVEATVKKHVRVFTAPTVIPKHVNTTIEEALPEAPKPENGVPGGVPGGRDGGVIGGDLDQVVKNLAPPAKAPVVERKPEPEVVKRVSVSSGVIAAKIVSQPRPAYPAMARTVRVQGTVLLNAVIGTDGRILNLNVASGPPLLVEAALNAVKQWRYEPTLLNGRPVEVQTTISVNFTLSN